MMLVTCRCGAAIAPHAASCGRCRAPVPHHAVPRPRVAPTTYAPYPLPAARPVPGAPARSSWSLGVVLGASVLVVLLAATVAVLALRPTTVVAAPTPAASTSVPETTTVTAAPTTVPRDTGSYGYGYGSADGGRTSSGDAPTDSASTSAVLLQEGVDSQRSDVEAVAGQWVPQLSAKKAGTEADGITYDSAAILSHYDGLRASYPDARLLYSGDWPVFTGGDFWVVVAARPFATAAAANAWCDAQGFAADDCLAKRLSHTGGPGGSSVPRS